MDEETLIQSELLIPAVSIDDFFAYMPQHNYIYVPSRDLWPAASVDARLPKIQDMKPSAWLDRNRPVEQMTWAPGLPMIIEDRLVSHGGWIEKTGVRCFNLYRPPTIELGDGTQATPWLDHVHMVYPADADHIIKWCAHRRQRPHEKINHSLFLGGDQGIGKDTLLEPVRRAIGPWNFSGISPKQIVGQWNAFLKSVVLCINEARDLGDISRYEFYEAMKPYTAAPPDVLRIDEKFIRQYYILNCVGVIITTNYKQNGIYLPATDRRTYVAWSEKKREHFSLEYWNKLWGWYDAGGDQHVAAYLEAVDLSQFNPKAPPVKTAAFWAIVDANRSPEDAELADTLDSLQNPDAVTLKDLIGAAPNPAFQEWLRALRNRRIIPHRLENCDYVAVRNPDADSGLWRCAGTRQVVYAKSSLTIVEQLNAVRKLIENPGIM